MNHYQGHQTGPSVDASYMQPRYGAAIGANACGNLARDASPVEAELNSLRAAQCSTHELLDELAVRLDSVLRPSEPQPCGKDGAGFPIMSPLCAQLLDRSAASASANQRLRDLIDRLTV